MSVSTTNDISSINVVDSDSENVEQTLTQTLKMPFTKVVSVTDGVNVTEQYLKLIHSEDVGVQENVA